MSYNVDAAIECARLNLGNSLLRNESYRGMEYAYSSGYNNPNGNSPYKEELGKFLFEIGQADAQISVPVKKGKTMFKVEFEVTMDEVVAALDDAVDCMDSETEHYRIVQALHKGLRNRKLKIVES